MGRAPFQVLVFLRRSNHGTAEYLLLRRADMGVWQGVAGGGEGDETPVEAAIRETVEETGVSVSSVIDLESVEILSVLDVAGFYRWGHDVELLPEHSFLADVPFDTPIQLSCEHTEYLWCDLQQALELLEWDSNKRALSAARHLEFTGSN